MIKDNDKGHHYGNIIKNTIHIYFNTMLKYFANCY